MTSGTPPHPFLPPLSREIYTQVEREGVCGQAPVFSQNHLLLLKLQFNP